MLRPLAAGSRDALRNLAGPGSGGRAGQGGGIQGAHDAHRAAVRGHREAAGQTEGGPQGAQGLALDSRRLSFFPCESKRQYRSFAVLASRGSVSGSSDVLRPGLYDINLGAV